MNTFSYLPRIVLSTVMALSLWAFTPTGVSATSAPMAEAVDTYEQKEDRDPSGYVLQVTGEGGVPTDGVTAVALNVTVTATETGAHDGFVTVFPCGDRPDASNLNFVANQTVPNLVIAPVSDAGEVCLYVYGRAHLIVDVSGYFTTGIEPLAPTRLLDTRGGGKVGALDGNGNIHRLHVTGSNGIPADGVTAVAMNVTATETATGAHDGFVTVFPCGTRPEASNLNFLANQTVPNLVIAPVSADGDVCFYVYGEAHLLADVSGYFTTGIETLTPTRLLDTRGSDKVGALDGNGNIHRLHVTGSNGIPADGVTAVAMNVTATETATGEHGGFVTVFPCGTRPEASNLNFVANQTVPNLVIAPVNDAGEVCFYVYGEAHLLADVSGYFTTGIETLTPTRLLDTRPTPGWSRDDKVGDFDGTSPTNRTEGCIEDYFGCLTPAVHAYIDATWTIADYQPSFPAHYIGDGGGWAGPCMGSECPFFSTQRTHVWSAPEKPSFADFTTFADNWCPVNPGQENDDYFKASCNSGHSAGGDFEVKWSAGTLTVKWKIGVAVAPGYDSWSDWYRGTQGDPVETCIADYFDCLTPAVHSYIDDAWTIADHQPSFPVDAYIGDGGGWAGPCMGSECPFFSTQRTHVWSAPEKPSFADFTTFAENWCPGQSTESLDGTAYWASCNSGHPAGGSFEVKWSAGILTVKWSIGVAVAPGYDSWSDWYRNEGKNL